MLANISRLFFYCGHICWCLAKLHRFTLISILIHMNSGSNNYNVKELTCSCIENWDLTLHFCSDNAVKLHGTEGNCKDRSQFPLTFCLPSDEHVHITDTLLFRLQLGISWATLESRNSRKKSSVCCIRLKNRKKWKTYMKIASRLLFWYLCRQSAWTLSFGLHTDISRESAPTLTNLRGDNSDKSIND